MPACPGLAGFFSKDEILFRTFDSGHTLLWAIGLLTSLLTAIYMFRLVFLAFHGDASGDAAPGHGTARRHPAHGPGTHLHDAPPAMAVALIVLAIGSVARRVRGPRLADASSTFSSRASRSPAGEAASSRRQDEHGESKLTLMVVSSLVAVAGIGLAVFLFLKRRDAADRVAGRFAGLHRVLEHKYYVDEIYDAAVVQPIHIVSEEGLWKTSTSGVIDGAVNGVGDGGERRQRTAAPSPDRLGARIRGVVVSRGGHGAGVLPVAIARTTRTRNTELGL